MRTNKIWIVIYVVLWLWGLQSCDNLHPSTPPDEINMVVGTYTDTISEGLYSFRFDQTSGKATSMGLIRLANPSYLTFSSDGRKIYVISESNDDTDALSVLTFNKKNGAMRFIDSLHIPFAGPCYIEADTGMIFTANYGEGSISEFLVRNNKLDSIRTLVTGSYGGPDTIRQAEPHIHCVRFSPKHDYLFATDFSGDQLLRFSYNRQRIKEFKPFPLHIDAGPRHFVFNKEGTFIYLMNELSCRVTVLRYKEGNVETIQEINTDTVNARGGADIHLSPDGNFLYASNRLNHDGIAIFSVNKANGLIKKVGYQTTYRHPRHFNITPNGKYLLCACRDDNRIQVFKRDETTGLLTDTKQDIQVGRPVCIQFTDTLYAKPHK